MDSTVRGRMSCAAFRRQIYHLQAGELSEAENRLCREHLESCASCAQWVEWEDGFERALRARLPRDQAPAELVRRVRDALANEPGGSGRGWFVRPAWAAALAAGVVLALLLLPTLRGGWGANLSAAGLRVERQVTVVDLQCDRAGYDLESQRACVHPDHVNALKLGPGRRWRLSSADGPGGRLRADRAMRGRVLRVRGLLDPERSTLQLTGFEDLGFYRRLAARSGFPGRGARAAGPSRGSCYANLHPRQDVGRGSR
jgi:hypothetical protein